MKPPRQRLLFYPSRIIGTIGLTVALAVPTASAAAEIKVLTSRVTYHALTELAREFQRTSEHRVALILASPAEVIGIPGAELLGPLPSSCRP